MDIREKSGSDVDQIYRIYSTDHVSTNPISTDHISTNHISTDPISMDPISTGQISRDPISGDTISTDILFGHERPQLPTNDGIRVKVEPVDLEFETNSLYESVVLKADDVDDGNRWRIIKEEIQEASDSHGQQNSRFSIPTEQPVPVALYVHDLGSKSIMAVGDRVPIDTKTELENLQDSAGTLLRHTKVDSQKSASEAVQQPSVRKLYSSVAEIPQTPASICWLYKASGVGHQRINIAPTENMSTPGEQIHYIPLTVVHRLATEDGGLVKKGRLGPNVRACSDISSVDAMTGNQCSVSVVKPVHSSTSSVGREYKPPFPLSVFDSLTYEQNSRNAEGTDNVSRGDNSASMTRGDDSVSVIRGDNSVRMTSEDNLASMTSGDNSVSVTSGDNISSLPRDLLTQLKNPEVPSRTSRPTASTTTVWSEAGKCNPVTLPDERLEEKPYKCFYCNYSCGQKGNLFVHLRLHTGKHYKCSECDFLSATANAIHRHSRLHDSVEKSYKCSVCGYKSAQQDAINKHEISHRGGKPFECSTCGYRSTVKSAIDDHVRKHLDQKPYACEICDYKTSNKTSLTKHVMLHSGYKPYICDMCGYKSATKNSLHEHMMTHTDLCDK